MSAPLLIAAALSVASVTLLLLKVSGVGRELFGSDAWMISRDSANESAADSRDEAWSKKIEDHEFWDQLDPEGRGFWDEMKQDLEEVGLKDEDDEEGPHIRAV